MVGLGLGLRLWGSTIGHPSNSWASCLLSINETFQISRSAQDILN